MKTIQLMLSILALVAATRATAALESAKLDPDSVMPQFPLPMQVAGITRGTLVVATSIGVEGKVTDSLVLGYTHESLIRPTLDVMKEWKFTPARLDGEAVPVQVVLTFEFTLEGAVITTNVINHFFFDHFARLGDGAFKYRVHTAGEIDRAPDLINSVKPKYAAEAEKQGIRGKVQVDFYIDEKGNVRMPAVTVGAHPYLSDQAVAAVREWKFTPPTHAGEPVLVAASQEFDFSEGK
jgi:TonB family protein